jgi:hypothetical protein
VLNELVQHRREVPGPVISMWSRHSRRSVPIQRSTIALAVALRTGVRRTRMSAPAKTASKGGELAVPIADQEPKLVGAVAEVHQQVAGLLGHPAPGGAGGDPRDVHPAGPVLDHHEDVEVAQ